MRYARRLTVTLLLALLIAFFAAPRGGRVKSALFHLGIGKGKEIEQIRKAVRTYNSSTQGVYATAGLAVDELAVIPATGQEKRRIYKDVNMLRTANLMVVFDKDKEVVEQVSFLDRTRAVAVTDEVWVLVLQEFTTRRKITNLKASQIRCRYHLLHYDGTWSVARVEVFPAEEALPSLNYRPAL
jgi:hypothetical protein